MIKEQEDIMLPVVIYYDYIRGHKWCYLSIKPYTNNVVLLLAIAEHRSRHTAIYSNDN